MKRPTFILGPIGLLALFSMLVFMSAVGPAPRVSASVAPLVGPANNFTVVATGLNNPRGLKFGPDGKLYVAEGGTGGTNPAVGCDPVDFPVGPYLGSETGGRISSFDQNWTRTTVIDTLPSSQTGPALGALVSGVADVAFIGDTLYAVLAGAGCSHGVSLLPNGVVRINSDGTSTLVADLSAFQQANHVANPSDSDFEPDGTWYSMIAVRGDLYAVEPNHGEVVRITPAGDITRVVDVSATEGHIVPTAIAYKGNFFFGNLGTFPVAPGTQQILKLNPGGQLKTWATGLTTVLGIAIDQFDRIYVLESMTAPGFPGPNQIGAGKVVRIDPNGRQTDIATGLSFPGGMTLGPDGALYVTNLSFGAGPGDGQIVRIEIPNSKPGKSQVHTTSQSTTVIPTETLPQSMPATVNSSTPGSLFLPNRSLLSLPIIESKQTDRELERLALKRFSETPDLGSIVVTVSGSRALLTGTVYSETSRAKAEKVLKQIVGIESINNQIYVAGP